MGWVLRSIFVAERELAVEALLWFFSIPWFPICLSKLRYPSIIWHCFSMWLWSAIVLVLRFFVLSCNHMSEPATSLAAGVQLRRVSPMRLVLLRRSALTWPNWKMTANSWSRLWNRQAKESRMRTLVALGADAMCSIPFPALWNQLCLLWPKGCRYWKLPKVQRVLLRHKMRSYDFDGCAVGTDIIKW